MGLACPRATVGDTATAPTPPNPSQSARCLDTAYFSTLLCTIGCVDVDAQRAVADEGCENDDSNDRGLERHGWGAL